MLIKGESILAVLAALILAILLLLVKATAEQIVISIAFIFVMFVAVRPETFLILFLIIRPCMDLMARQQIAGTINSASIATLFFVLIGSTILLRKGNMSKIRGSKVMLNANKTFLCFLIISLLSFINSRNFLISFADWLRLLSVIIIFNYAFIYFSEDKIFKKLFIIILSSAIVPLCFGAYQYLFDKGNHLTFGFNRINGTFLHPNVFAEYLVILFITILYFLKAHKLHRILRFISYFASIIIFFEIFCTYTRGAWIALAISLIVFNASYTKYKKLIYFILIFMVALVIFPKIQGRFMDIRHQKPDQQNSWEWRVRAWNDTKNEIKKNYIIGYGLGMYAENFSFMAHNDYLRFAYEVGIPGLIFYLLFLLFIFAESIKKIIYEKNTFFKTRYATIASLMVAFLIMGAVDNLARSTLVLLYMFCVIGALLGNKPNINIDLNGKA